MTASTAATGFLPSYDRLGILAPLLFTALRLIQGLAVGGELPDRPHFSSSKKYFHKGEVLQGVLF